MNPKIKKRLVIILTTIPLLCLLVGFVFLSTAGSLHSKLLEVAESNWQGYSELRESPVPPTCDPNAEKPAEPAAAPQNAEDEEDIDLDDLFGEKEQGVSDEAFQAAKQQCVAQFEKYNRILEKREDASLQRFISFEGFVGKIVQESTDFGRAFLILIFLFCATAATLGRSHLGLRNPDDRRSDRVNQITMACSNLIILFSFLAYYLQDIASGVEEISNLPIFWMVAFGCMTLTNIILLIFDPLPNTERTSIGKTLLGIPLYVYMTALTAFYFGIIEGHFAGIAIYLNQITEHASLYINVALYVFCGMMLKNTDIADRFFGLIRPWKLTPELLFFIIILLSAFPTAYSGASGIFVIACGAIIYKEFKHGDMRNSMAQAGTAMCGSMGIVLNPCLLVVIIAALNDKVSTDELFHEGIYVFIINIIIVFTLMTALFFKRPKKENEKIAASPKVAFPAMLRALLPLLPYVGLILIVLGLFHFGLGTSFTAYTAPILLPFILLVLLIYDRIIAKSTYKKALASATDENKPEKPFGIRHALLEASSSTASSTGGLLTLMTLSICVGGIIDRANLRELLPQHFASPFLAMALLLVILVIIGMIMDPYGAVILVSASITQIAYNNGISPLHFWLVVLCAFELGYLTPPVALNHLLTRQIIGEGEYVVDKEERKQLSFWKRHERILIPITIKGIALLLIAFMPLILNMKI